MSKIRSACIDYIKYAFPQIDEELTQYVQDVLTNGAEDFEKSEDVYEAIGNVLHEISVDKNEKDIRKICSNILILMNPIQATLNDQKKVLNAPVNIASMVANSESQIGDEKSIWAMQRDKASKVDAKKLEKAEAKLKQKLEKRSGDTVKPMIRKTNSATASQPTNKKEIKLEAKGMNRTKDIHIENFDIAYGDRVLLEGADMMLACGRRYGLLGRNGFGKTTLLRMISDKQLHIPSHISILHVEQEVVGDDTLALDSVLQCDYVREHLLKREKEISAALNSGSTDLKLNTALSEVYAELQNIEADKAPAKASIILNGLGFSSAMQTQPTKLFSGGWRMRLALARALFSRPDLLLLDEPTNMLDIKAIIWLENYLQNWPTTLLVASHNRHFLDTVPTDILFLHSRKIETYRGNYEQFVKTKTEKHRNQQKEYDAQQQHRAHVQIFIDRFRYNIHKASSVQSKIKLLEKLPILTPVQKERQVVLKFPKIEPLLPPILQLHEVAFQYTKDRFIFRNVNLGATLDSRICIVGDNGAGKTTLLKIIMGMLTPTSGVQSTHRNLKFGYFGQHHIDQLNMNQNSIELLRDSHKGRPIEAYRRQLGSFGISGDMALQSVESLSGGQKSRVAFARMCMGTPNFLVLDEPTNHLDIETIEALGKGINKYNGGVILVSHNERLIRMVCKELWVCGNGAVTSINGGFDEYRKIVENELAEAQAKQ